MESRKRPRRLISPCGVVVCNLEKPYANRGVDERLAELSAKGDDLEWVKSLVDFEMFRPALEAAVPRADRSLPH